MIELIPNEWRYRDSETKLPYPWYVKPVVEILDKMDLNGKLIFEYGLGDSTDWFCGKGAITCGVDHCLDFVPPMKGSQYIVALSQESYTGAINRYIEMFDIIAES